MPGKIKAAVLASESRAELHYTADNVDHHRSCRR